MKREPKSLALSDDTSVPDDWYSDVSDILDDVMWDELREDSSLETHFSAPFESNVAPIDEISGASPVKRSTAQVNSLSLSTEKLLAPIRGEDDVSMILSAGGGLSCGLNFFEPDAESAADHSQPGVNYDQTLSIAPTNLKIPGDSVELRRQRNRDWMRKARQRQKEDLNSMKDTVTRLEKQYAELSLKSSNTTQNMAVQGTGSDGVLVTRMTSDYTEAVELTRRLGAENLYLKAEIQQQAAWKLNLSRILQSTMEVDGPRWAQQFQQPPLGGEEVLRMKLDERDQCEAAEEFAFHPLTDLGLTQVILENSRTMSRVQNSLLIPSSLDTDGDAWTRRTQVFGWDMKQRVHGSIMECVFTKKFRGLNVAQLMQKTWANDMRLGEFKKVKGETARLEVLQQVNPNAYVLARDVKSPTDDISIFRSVFVRFLIETSKKIPLSDATSTATFIDANVPCTPPQDAISEEPMLDVTGFVLGTQSIDTDYSRNPRDEDIRNKVARAHLSLSIEFFNVVNHVTREEYQQLRWTCRTNYLGPEHARRNATDTMHGMLRWELLVIAPAVNLVSLSLE